MWFSPTDATASGNNWEAGDDIDGDYRAPVYDNDTSTATSHNVSATSWSPYLTITRPATTCSKVRFYATYNATTINKITLEVYYNGAWNEITTSGGEAFADMAWVEKSITGVQSVTQARVKFYNTSAGSNDAFLYEFDFFNGVVPMEQVWSWK